MITDNQLDVILAGFKTYGKVKFVGANFSRLKVMLREMKILEARTGENFTEGHMRVNVSFRTAVKPEEEHEEFTDLMIEKMTRVLDGMRAHSQITTRNDDLKIKLEKL